MFFSKIHKLILLIFRDTDLKFYLSHSVPRRQQRTQAAGTGPGSLLNRVRYSLRDSLLLNWGSASPRGESNPPN